jgi:hypothetical protein
MIHRNSNGKLALINKLDFKNDELFFNKIILLKKEQLEKIGIFHEIKKVDVPLNIKNYVN